MPASLALGSLIYTASPGAVAALTPGLHSSCPFTPVLIALPLALILGRPLFLFFDASSSETYSSSSSSPNSLSGGEEIKLADASSSSYPEPSLASSDSDSLSELELCSKYWLFLGVVFSDVVGEDLRRFDWRDGGVGLAERVCFRGEELEDALGK